jgi:hypothetical protein
MGNDTRSVHPGMAPFNVNERGSDRPLAAKVEELD